MSDGLPVQDGFCLSIHPSLVVSRVFLGQAPSAFWRVVLSIGRLHLVRWLVAGTSAFPSCSQLSGVSCLFLHS